MAPWCQQVIGLRTFRVIEICDRKDAVMNSEEGAASWDRGGARLNGACRNVTLDGLGPVTLRSFQKEILIVFFPDTGVYLLCCCFVQCYCPSGVNLHLLKASEQFVDRKSDWKELPDKSAEVGYSLGDWKEEMKCSTYLQTGRVLLGLFK